MISENAITPADKPKPAKFSDKDRRRKYGLRVKQWKFVKHYLGRAQGNATKAYQLAGYESYNAESARACAARLLAHANVQRALEAEQAAGFGGPEDIQNVLAAIAKGNAADWFERNPVTGRLEPSLEKLEAAGALGLIQEYSMTENGPKIKMYSRLRAAETLAKINGQIIDRKEHSGPGGGPIPITHKVVTDDDIVRARAVAAQKQLPPANGNGGGNGHG